MFGQTRSGLCRLPPAVGSKLEASLSGHVLGHVRCHVCAGPGRQVRFYVWLRVGLDTQGAIGQTSLGKAVAKNLQEA